MRFHRSVCQGSSHRLRIPKDILRCTRYGKDRKGIQNCHCFQFQRIMSSKLLYSIIADPSLRVMRKMQIKPIKGQERER